MVIDPNFFKQPTLKLAKQLLGSELVHHTEKGILSGKIVEVEAYKGPEDKAAHSFGGRRTKRTEVMYGPPGHIYMFLIYGIHHCFNIVSGPFEKPEAILVRALEPTEGIEQMMATRFPNKLHNPKFHLKQLTNGPGKLCKAMEINMRHNGLSLLNSPIQLRTDNVMADCDIGEGPRINIGYAEEHVQLPWRFFIRNNPYVSK